MRFKVKSILITLAVVLGMTAFSFPASANVSADEYGVNDSVESKTPLTPGGNMTKIDDVHQVTDKDEIEDKAPLNLTKTEFDILYLLASHRGQTFSRDMIYSNIWNDDMLDDRSITTHIQRLRKKIEDDPDNPKYILTVRGVGYKFNRELTQ